MNRKILFRGKRTDNGEWVYGSFVHLFEKNPFSRVANMSSDMYFIVEINGKIQEVDKETVSQYTGLNDKNGQKIWENDIVRFHGNDKDLVKIVFGEFVAIETKTLQAIDKVVGWHYEVLPTDELSKIEPFNYPMPINEYYVEVLDAEVIGNIFDNKEILEAGGISVTEEKE